MKRIETLLRPTVPFRVVRKENREPDEWEQFHSHNGVELLYVHRGRGSVTIDRRLHPIADGTLVIVRPFQHHKLRLTICEAQPYIRTVFLFDPAAAKRYLRYFPTLLDFLRRLAGCELESPVLRAPEGSGIHNIFSSLDEERSQSEESYALALLNLLNFLEGRREFQENVGTGKRVTHHAEQIMEYISRHYREELKLSRISQALHLSESYVSRIFHKYTGSTVMAYANALRLREACALLAATPMSVKEICARIGVSSPSYLCQLFRKHYDTTPLVYRQLCHSSPVPSGGPAHSRSAARRSVV